MNQNEKLMDDLVRELSLDEQDATSAPNKEARKWMAARSYIFDVTG
jgi:hypothetical protein